MKFKILVDIPDHYKSSAVKNVKDSSEPLPFRLQSFKNGKWNWITVGYTEDCKIEEDKLFYVVNVIPKYIHKIERLKNAEKCVF